MAINKQETPVLFSKNKNGNPIVKKFQKLINKAYFQSRQRQSLWVRLCQYVRCAEISKISPELRTHRQCRQLADWIWTSLPGNNILSRVHWQDRSKISKYITYLKVPKNTVVSLQGETPNDFKILLGGLCSEWVISKEDDDDINIKPKLMKISENNNDNNKRRINNKSYSQHHTRNSSLNGTLFSAKTRMNSTDIYNDTHRSYNDYADLVQLQSSLLRKVSLLPGEADNVLAAKLATLNDSKSSTQSISNTLINNTNINANIISNNIKQQKSRIIINTNNNDNNRKHSIKHITFDTPNHEKLNKIKQASRHHISKSLHMPSNINKRRNEERSTLIGEVLFGLNKDTFIVNKFGKRLRTLKPGSSFDSLILFNDKHESSKSIVTECECEFLILKQKDLNKVLKLNNRKRLRTKVLVLEQLKIFNELNYSNRLRFSNISKLRTFQNNQTIPIIDDNKLLLYFIVSGNVKIIYFDSPICMRSDNSILNAYSVLIHEKHEQISNINSNNNNSDIFDYFNNENEKINLNKYNNIMNIYKNNKIKIKCVGKCELIRFYCDELFHLCDTNLKNTLYKLCFSYLDQLKKYVKHRDNHIKFINFSKPVYALTKYSHNDSIKNNRKIFNFNIKSKVINKSKSLPNIHKNSNNNKRSNNKNMFNNLLSPSMINLVNNMDKISEIYYKIPTPRTFGNVLIGKQNIDKTFIIKNSNKMKCTSHNIYNLLYKNGSKNIKNYKTKKYSSQLIRNPSTKKLCIF